MKKIAYLTLLLTTISINAFSKVIMVEEPGYGQVGLMMNCGVHINTKYNSDYVSTEMAPSHNEAIKLGGSLFYDFSYFDSKLGLLAGWDGTYMYKDKSISINNFKIGLRAYRFLTIGPVIGISNECDGLDFGGFVNITVLPFKYCGIGCEAQFTVNYGLSVMGSFSITIPTKRVKD